MLTVHSVNSEPDQQLKVMGKSELIKHTINKNLPFYFKGKDLECSLNSKL